MKRLVDNPLPVSLARFLAANGIDCRHVSDAGLENATDQVIWQLASQEGWVIVTKD